MTPEALAALDGFGQQHPGAFPNAVVTGRFDDQVGELRDDGYLLIAVQATSIREYLDPCPWWHTHRSLAWLDAPSGTQDVAGATVRRPGMQHERPQHHRNHRRALLELSDFGAGCSAVAVTVSADEPELIEGTGNVFRSWRQAIADVLQVSGLNAQQAGDLSMMMLAAREVPASFGPLSKANRFRARVIRLCPHPIRASSQRSCRPQAQSGSVQRVVIPDQRLRPAWGGGRQRIGWRGLVTCRRTSRFRR